MATRRLDEISIFDGKLTFLIPHEWIEDDDGADQDSYLYHLPNATSGFFRVSLITSSGPELPARRLQKLVSEWPNRFLEPETGNFVRAWHENGKKDPSVHLYYWAVANVIPNGAREALFSYTVNCSEAGLPEVESEVQLIGQLVGKSKFA